MRKLLLALWLLALPACGGRVYYAAAYDDGGAGSASSSSPSGDDSDAGSSTAPGSPFPVCPGRAPKTGSSCPNPNQGCAYVDLQAGTCESWTCSATNVWESSTPAGC